MSRVLIWGHSDQTGGTEIACLLYEMLRSNSVGGINLDVSILTHSPDSVDEYFKYTTMRFDRARDVIETPRLLRLGKTQQGEVDGYKTLEIFNQPPFLPLDPSFTGLQEAVSDIANQIKTKYGSEPKLMISCGEPLALKVANKLNINGVIISDILLTSVVQNVLENSGLLLESKVARLLDELEDYDHMADMAILAPVEFSSYEYEQYLSNGGVYCLPMGGLFYEPIGRDTLAINPPYKELTQAAKGNKIVFVFGGGGPLWLDLYKDLADEYVKASKGLTFGLLLPETETKDGKLVRRRKGGTGSFIYQLYLPDGTATELEDPGKLMYWYAACTLVIGRGGLVAQQVFATMLSDLPDTPEMLFIEEPGHPQIEHERRSLYNLSFVHSRRLVDFRQQKLKIIQEIMNQMSTHRTSPRYAVAVRYGRGTMERLGKYLIQRYI